ncbi:MAG: hypothetical protein IPN80_13645 [Flavobacterium sp.]|nr:hypothetical protein [Flavobacterium sp.]
MRKLSCLIVFFLILSCEKDATDNTAVDLKREVVVSKTYGGSLEEKTNSIVNTPDGGMLILGYTSSNDGDIIKTHAQTDIWLTKLDANGAMLWSKTIGGAENDYGTSIAATSDGNYIISGYSGSNDGDVPGNLGLHDFYISKITGEGNVIWTKKLRIYQSRSCAQNNSNQRRRLFCGWFCGLFWNRRHRRNR